MASAGAKKPMNSTNNQSGSSSKNNIISPDNNNNNQKNNLKKKIECFSSNKPQQFFDPKNKSIPPKNAKSEIKGKSIAPTTPVKKAKRERKVYNLPGQKHDPPEEREPLRIFYESLSKQIPTSEMAEFWMMEHGMLSPERAKKAYEKKQRKQKQLRMVTPIKSSSLPSRPESSNRQKLTLKNSSTITTSKTSATNTASKNGATNTKRKVVEDSDDEVIASPKRIRA